MNAHATIEAADAPMAGGLILRSTVESIVAKRNAALLLYETAHGALMAADRALQAAGEQSTFHRVNRYNHHLYDPDSKAPDGERFVYALKFAERDLYLRKARQHIDTNAWAHVIELTGLEHLMDKKAKEQFYGQLQTDPPEFTAENVYATVEQFAMDADMIFRRGISECFSKLDRRFRSHDGFKIGHRVVLSYAFGYSGSFSWGSNQGDSLIDIERTFRRLDGKPPAEGGSIVDLVNHDRKHFGAQQSDTENEYFRVKGYKNGNCHIWFKRDDLLEKVNRLLAEYYGEVLGDGKNGEQEDDGGLFTPKTTVAKRFGFFPTPDETADRVIDDVPLSGYRQREGKDDVHALTILEPSAGTGQLARRCLQHVNEGQWDDNLHRRRQSIIRHHVDCVEIQQEMAGQLEREGVYRRVYAMDFLKLRPDPSRLYDRIVMNPPFDMERDIDHVMHATKFLKPDGFLISIMSAGVEWRETRKATAFRKFIEAKGGRFTELPAGSFASCGTYVNTSTVKFWNNGSRI